MDRLVCSLSLFSEANFRWSVLREKTKIEDTVAQQWFNTMISKALEVKDRKGREFKTYWSLIIGVVRVDLEAKTGLLPVGHEDRKYFQG